MGQRKRERVGGSGNVAEVEGTGGGKDVAGSEEVVEKARMWQRRPESDSKGENRGLNNCGKGSLYHTSVVFINLRFS